MTEFNLNNVLAVVQETISLSENLSTIIIVLLIIIVIIIIITLFGSKNN